MSSGVREPPVWAGRLSHQRPTAGAERTSSQGVLAPPLLHNMSTQLTRSALVRPALTTRPDLVMVRNPGQGARWINYSGTRDIAL